MLTTSNADKMLVFRKCGFSTFYNTTEPESIYCRV